MLSIEWNDTAWFTGLSTMFGQNTWPLFNLILSLVHIWINSNVADSFLMINTTIDFSPNDTIFRSVGDASKWLKLSMCHFGVFNLWQSKISNHCPLKHAYWYVQITYLVMCSLHFKILEGWKILQTISMHDNSLKPVDMPAPTPHCPYTPLPVDI